MYTIELTCIKVLPEEKRAEKELVLEACQNRILELEMALDALDEQKSQSQLIVREVCSVDCIAVDGSAPRRRFSTAGDINKRISQLQEVSAPQAHDYVLIQLAGDRVR